MIDSTLGDLFRVCVLAYLDELLIFYNNEEDHEVHLKAVMRRLADAKFSGKLSKCEFF